MLRIQTSDVAQCTLTGFELIYRLWTGQLAEGDA